MKASRIGRFGILGTLLALALFLVPAGASAHDRRDLAGGKYQAVVGFLTEPAIQNQMNGIDLTITDMSQKDASGKGTPVEGLEKTLKAEIVFGGGAKKEIPLAARFGTPGKYAGYFMPTEAGSYTFHIFGSINDAKVDERFESGPGRFDDVKALSTVQFPSQVAVPANLQQQLDAAKSSANMARIFGIAGLAVGILGLGTAGFALTRRPTRRDEMAGDAPQATKRA